MIECSKACKAKQTKCIPATYFDKACHIKMAYSHIRSFFGDAVTKLDNQIESERHRLISL